MDVSLKSGRFLAGSKKPEGVLLMKSTDYCQVEREGDPTADTLISHVPEAQCLNPESHGPTDLTPDLILVFDPEPQPLQHGRLFSRTANGSHGIPMRASKLGRLAAEPQKEF